MRVDELPEDVERIWKGTSKKIVHLDEDCHSIGQGGVNEWSTHGRAHLKVCAFCGNRHGFIEEDPLGRRGTAPNDPLTFGKLKNDIDVEAAMLEHAPEDPA